ncbi:uncharacterized protein LOC131685242 isoform X2 [Topomyia yanbarensis]|uniref:uncharacterized protein LOC131685242 isoform X2 n=1 Tax=Topomyia yanbarensis TaxID=2498891 RepID=UPI00273B4003|nr:uncharacterized protein LOC131685242 isoform X2 [Topomyia yanbarensis]
MQLAELSDMEESPIAANDQVQSTNPTSSESGSITSSVEDLQSWSLLTDSEQQSEDHLNTINRVKRESSENSLNSQDSCSSDSISVISESEEALPHTRLLNTHFVPEEDVKNKEDADQVPAKDETSQLPRKMITWTTPLVLGVVLATNAAILYGHSRMYHNLVGELKIVHEARIADLMNNTAKNLERISELELENSKLRNQIECLKCADTPTELGEQIYQSVVKMLTSQVKNKVTRTLLKPEIADDEHILNLGGPPPDDYTNPNSQDEIFSEDSKVEQDNIPKPDNLKMPFPSQGDVKKFRALPSYCYNSFAVQDALFSEECNFDQTKQIDRDPHPGDAFLKDDAPPLKGNLKRLPIFCYNKYATQDALYSADCDYGEIKPEPKHRRSMHFKKLSMKTSHRGKHGHNRRSLPVDSKQQLPKRGH